MTKQNQCKICRRAGTKLFLKGERCFSSKCAIIRKPYAPGEKSKKRRSAFSEYAKELREKQKMKNWYGLSEKQMQKYVNEALKERKKDEDASILLVSILEKRLDNVIFRSGLTSSRKEAKQMVSYSHFLINGKPVNIPSFRVKEGDVITVKESFAKKDYFQRILKERKKDESLKWLIFDDKKIEIKVVGSPLVEDVLPPVEISSIFEYYSR